MQWSLRACSRQSDARPGSPSGKDMRPDYQEHGQLTATSCPLLQDMPQLRGAQSNFRARLWSKAPAFLPSTGLLSRVGYAQDNLPRNNPPPHPD